jgi:hypothetical protein
MKSTNNGDTWSLISEYFPTSQAPYSTHADIRDFEHLGLSSTGKEILYMANDGGLSKTTNSGAQWLDLNGNGLIASEADGVAFLNKSGLLAFGNIHNRITSKNNQGNWQYGFYGGDVGWMNVHPFKSDTVFFVNNGAPSMAYHKQLTDNLFSTSFSNTPDTVHRNPITNNWTYGERGAKLGLKIETSRLNPKRVYYGFNTFQYYDLINLSWNKLFERDTSNRSGGVINSFKVAPSDKNRIYIAYEDPTYNQGTAYDHKFFRTDDEGVTWTNITANLYALKWTWITDMAIDPYNPDRIWVGLSGYRENGDWRVFYSEDAGDNWIDISEGKTQGLPMFAINCLAYQEGSNDVLYAGTDAGVYYWDNLDSNWHCFNNGLPPVIIKQLNFNECNNTLLAATQGRGIWQAPLIESNKDYVIDSNTTWESYPKRVLRGNLMVENGSTLTVKGSVYFAPGKNLTIQPGAKVVLDGGELTANKTCGNAPTNWEGINVLGNAALPQNPTTHGVLQIKNGGTISHARTAVSNVGWAGNDFAWGTQGGIVSATNAKFVNNRRDLQFISFHNHWYGNYEWDYQASFVNCTFSRDSNYTMEEPNASVSMWEVNGIKFLGCTFTNQPSSFAHSGHGIYAIGAQFLVNQRQPLEGLPDNTTFNGYKYAIHATNVCRADRFTTIANSEFTNNRHGIYLNTHANARVVKNSFSVPDLPAPSGGNPPYGVYFDASTGYVFLQNAFAGVGNTYPKVGTVFNNSGADANRAYKNTYNNFTYATEAIGNNKEAAGINGLQFRCNNFGPVTDNSIDIAVWATATNPHGPQGIAANQGYADPIAPLAKDLANNLFSLNQQDVYNDLAAYQFNYYFGIGEARFDPYNSHNIIENNVFTATSYVTDCPDTLGTGIGPNKDLNQLKSELQVLESDLFGKRALYFQLINGGNTTELEALILFATQHAYLDLYIDLMTIAPYVDEAQLIDLINNTDFPELALRNVLVANPHSGRSPAVMDALRDRQPAVSQQTISDVENGSQTITAKDVLEADMGITSQYIAQHLRDIQYYYVTDSTFWDTDSLTHLFENRTEAPYVFMLAEYRYQKLGATPAYNTLMNLDQTWWGEEDIQTGLHLMEYYNILDGAETNNETMATLSSASLGSLQSLQQQTTSTWLYHRIDGVLAAYGLNNNEYLEPVYLQTSEKTTDRHERPFKVSSNFELYPNPASGYTELHWDWFKQGLEGSFSIHVFNPSGQVKEVKVITDFRKNVIILHTSTYSPGIYFVQILDVTGEMIYAGKLIIQ